jgi:hypothetical protein
MKPNKLKRYLEMKNSEMRNQLEKWFRRKLDEIRIQQKRFVNTATVSSKALLASYLASYRIAQNNMSHRITENVLLPEVIDTVQCSVKNVLSSFIIFFFLWR